MHFPYLCSAVRLLGGGVLSPFCWSRFYHAAFFFCPSFLPWSRFVASPRRCGLSFSRPSSGAVGASLRPRPRVRCWFSRSWFLYVLRRCVRGLCVALLLPRQWPPLRPCAPRSPWSGCRGLVRARAPLRPSRASVAVLLRWRQRRRFALRLRRCRLVPPSPWAAFPAFRRFVVLPSVRGLWWLLLVAVLWPRCRACLFGLSGPVRVSAVRLGRRPLRPARWPLSGPCPARAGSSFRLSRARVPPAFRCPLLFLVPVPVLGLLLRRRWLPAAPRWFSCRPASPCSRPGSRPGGAAASLCCPAVFLLRGRGGLRPLRWPFRLLPFPCFSFPFSFCGFSL